MINPLMLSVNQSPVDLRFKSCSCSCYSSPIKPDAPATSSGLERRLNSSCGFPSKYSLYTENERAQRFINEVSYIKKLLKRKELCCIPENAQEKKHPKKKPESIKARINRPERKNVGISLFNHCKYLNVTAKDDDITKRSVYSNDKFNRLMNLRDRSTVWMDIICSKNKGKNKDGAFKEDVSNRYNHYKFMKQLSDLKNRRIKSYIDRFQVLSEKY